MTSNPLLGAIILSVGGCSSALCYTPQKKTSGWSWQSYWLAQALACWLILPWLGAWLTTPDLGAVLSEAPTRVMVHTLLLGALFGIGGTAFGIAIRYLGFSLSYAIAMGISCVLGTLFTPLLSGELAAQLTRPGTGWVLAGVAVAAFGILVSGLAGWLKDHDLRKSNAAPEGFQLRKGLFFCVLAGVLSAVFGISLDVGRPIALIAAAHGAGQFQGNVVYIFSCGGAMLTTGVYCLFLHLRQGTLGEYARAPAGSQKDRAAHQLCHGRAHGVALVRAVFSLRPWTGPHGRIQVHKLGNYQRHGCPVQRACRPADARVERLPPAYLDRALGCLHFVAGCRGTDDLRQLSRLGARRAVTKTARINEIRRSGDCRAAAAPNAGCRQTCASGVCPALPA